MSMLVGIAVAMLILSWYAPNVGRALAVLTVVSMLAVLYSDPKPRRRYRSPPSQLEPQAARAFLGVSGVMFVLAHVASRRRRGGCGIARAIVVRGGR